MKPLLPLLSAVLLAITLNGQSNRDSILINGDLFWYKDLGHHVEYVAGHINQDVQAHPEGKWQYYLSKPHPSIAVIDRYFQQASVEFGVPVDLLKAIGQIENNWTQMGPSIDKGWGIMHLVQNNYCNTLHEAALLLGINNDDVLKEDAQQNIRGAAALLSHYMGAQRTANTRIEDWYNAVKKYSGLISDELQTIQADRYYGVVCDGARSTTLWDEEIILPRHKEIDFRYIASHFKIAPPSYEHRDSRSSDYGPAIADMTTCNYTSGRNHSIDTWVNHWIGTGTAAGAVSWFKNCSANASAHFVTATSGTIYQVVPVANTAWHCGASGYPYNNSRSIGEEHEATNANPGLWNSTAMLQASANMACYFCNQYGIATHQNHTSPGICGHQNMPGTNTDCPGTIPWSTWFGYFTSGTCTSAAPIQPANDYCGNEVLLTVYGATCGAATSGDVNGSTQSTAPTTCDGYASTQAKDVWFKFVATAASHVITVVPSSGMDAVVDLRSGSCPGTSINCEDQGGGEGSTEVLQATGLTVGNTYYVRVYDYTGANNPPTTTTFTICVTTTCTNPTTPTISGTNTICSGHSSTLSVSNPCNGCTFTWSNGGTGNSISATTAGTYRVTASNNCGSVGSNAFTLTVNQTPQPTISNLSNSYCVAGADVTLSGTPVGGTFSGAVINGNVFSPSTAGVGTHAVTYTVTQSGCTGSVSQSTTVSSAPSVQITANGPTAFCSGGSVQLTATQGSAYSWSNNATTQTITVSQGGSYNVTVTNPGGCTASVIANSPQTVTVYPNPVAAAGPNQSLLLVTGNSVVIGGSPSASGGTSPYTYSWSPAAGLSSSSIANPAVSNLTVTTTYILTVTDANGCSATDNVVVTPVTPCQYTTSHNYFSFTSDGGIDSFFVDANDTSCIWNVSGCSWITFQSPGLPASGDAWFVFSVNANNDAQPRVCSITLTGGQNIVVTQQGKVVDPCNPPLPIPTITVNNCELATDAMPTVTYQWYHNSNSIPLATTRFHTVTQSGYYYVQIADSNFCTAQSADTYMNYPACLATGIEGVKEEILFEVYPNPVGDVMNVSCHGMDKMNFSLYDASGRLIIRTWLTGNSATLNVANLAKGIYSAIVTDSRGLQAIKKVVR